MEILKIHARSVSKSGDIDYEAIVKLSDGFNGADLRNVVTEAGMFAIRAERDAVIQEDFTKAARKVSEAKKHESECLSLCISVNFEAVLRWMVPSISLFKGKSLTFSPTAKMDYSAQ